MWLSFPQDVPLGRRAVIRIDTICVFVESDTEKQTLFRRSIRTRSSKCWHGAFVIFASFCRNPVRGGLEQKVAKGTKVGLSLVVVSPGRSIASTSRHPD